MFKTVKKQADHIGDGVFRLSKILSKEKFSNTELWEFLDKEISCMSSLGYLKGVNCKGKLHFRAGMEYGRQKEIDDNLYLLLDHGLTPSPDDSSIVKILQFISECAKPSLKWSNDDAYSWIISGKLKFIEAMFAHGYSPFERDEEFLNYFFSNTVNELDDHFYLAILKNLVVNYGLEKKWDSFVPESQKNALSLLQELRISEYEHVEVRQTKWPTYSLLKESDRLLLLEHSGLGEEKIIQLIREANEQRDKIKAYYRENYKLELHDAENEKQDQKEEKEKSCGTSVSDGGMLDTEIEINLSSISLHKNNNCYIEETVLNTARLPAFIKNWQENYTSYGHYLAIVTLKNQEGAKHAIAFHAEKFGDILIFEIIDSLTHSCSRFEQEADELTKELSVFPSNICRIYNTGQQDPNSSTCADMSLLQLFELYHKINLDQLEFDQTTDDKFTNQLSWYIQTNQVLPTLGATLLPATDNLQALGHIFEYFDLL